MNNQLLSKSIQVLILIFLAVAALYFGREFLIPLAFGGLLAMLFLPFSSWLEKKGLNRGFAALIPVLTFLAIVTGIVWLIAWQVTDLTSDLGNMEKRVQEMISQLRQYITNNLGISVKQQDQLLQSSSSGGSGAGGMITGFAGSMMGILVNLVLVLVYIFLFLYFRSHIRKFILMLVPVKERPNADQTIHDGQKVSRQYLTGLSLMIVCLWIMYGVGFSITGVRNAIFFAILCGLLEIVPFVGNLIGTTLTVLMAFTQGGGTGMVIGIICTYALVQFIQTYILEPLVVGSEVNINPLFTIIVLVLGELLWGIPGMILAIPITGILKIVFDHIPALKPYGFLIGENKKKKKGGFKEKVRGWFK